MMHTMKTILVLLLFVSGLSAQSVKLAWDAPVDVTGITGFNVYRSQTSNQYPGTPVNAAPLPLGQLNFEDTGVAYGQSYFYVVKSAGSGVLSLPSNEITVTVGTPSTPTNPTITDLRCATGNGRTFVISWTITAPTNAAWLRVWYEGEEQTGNFIHFEDAIQGAVGTRTIQIQAGRKVNLRMHGSIGTDINNSPFAPGATLAEITCLAGPQNLRKQ